MTRHDWPIVWTCETPARLAADIIAHAVKRGGACVYVHGQRMLITTDFDQRHADDCAGIFCGRESHAAIIAKLVNAFDAAMGDKTP